MTARPSGTPGTVERRTLRIARGGSQRDKTSFSRALLDYLAELEVSQGRLSGRSFTVLPWQARFILGAFRDGTTSAALSVGRGNGKTTLLSGIPAIESKNEIGSGTISS